MDARDPQTADAQDGDDQKTELDHHVTFRLTGEQYDKLRVLADKRRWSMAMTARVAVEEYVAQDAADGSGEGVPE